MPNLHLNDEINEKITDDDELKALKSLKNGKACASDDQILNEFLKSSQQLMLPLYTRLFNFVFETGKNSREMGRGVYCTNL